PPGRARGRPRLWLPPEPAAPRAAPEPEVSTVHVPMRRAALAAAVSLLVLPAAASAHAIVSPSVVKAKTSEVFTLAVPTEEEDATTAKVELVVPDGFDID